MSTLIEIEAAVEALPMPRQVALFHRLEGRLRSPESDRARLVEEDGVRVLVAPRGAPVMTPDLVKAALADFS